MRPKYYQLLGLIFAACFIPALDCHADLVFDVSLDTSGLMGHSAGPFYIDFQLNDGSGNFSEGVNTAKISNFSGGRLTGTPQLFGGATGSLAAGSTLTLKDNAALINEFFQTFTPGSLVSFHVSLTTNVDSGPIPDAFSFSILDNLLSPIPTTNFADAFLFVNINSAIATQPDLLNSILAGDPTRPPFISIGMPQVTGIPVVPETGSAISMLLIALGVVWCFQWRFFHVT
jgi:hypothetical protein